MKFIHMKNSYLIGSISKLRVASVVLFSLIYTQYRCYGQSYSLYSTDTITFQSKFLQKDIELNLHIPETHSSASDSTLYPVIIIFDSQHQRTYPHIIQSFDLLTGETQVPESILVGVPFGYADRYYLTSNEIMESDSLSGIERMELFLFSELIPHIQHHYKGNEYLMLVGHSRTAYLVNYLSWKRPQMVKTAVALSGFFNQEPLSTDIFFRFLSDAANFKSKFRYYYTTGTTREESTYRNQCRELDSLLTNKSLTTLASITYFETQSANHITNYWLSVAPIFTDIFSSYNNILDQWLFEKLQSNSMDLSVQSFCEDLEKAGEEIGIKLNPSITQIYSIASHFINTEEDYITAIDYLELGLAYYPDYLDFYLDLIDFSRVINNTDDVASYSNILREKVMKRNTLSSEEKAEFIRFLENN